MKYKENFFRNLSMNRMFYEKINDLMFYWLYPIIMNYYDYQLSKEIVTAMERSSNTIKYNK